MSIGIDVPGPGPRFAEPVGDGSPRHGMRVGVSARRTGRRSAGTPGRHGHKRSATVLSAPRSGVALLVLLMGGIVVAQGLSARSTAAKPASASTIRPAAAQPVAAGPESLSAAGPGAPPVTVTGSTSVVVDPAHPSGVKMPTKNPKGWTQTFKDDFNGHQLNSAWFRYGGQPGGDPGGWWAHSHAVVGHGVLALRTSIDPAACKSCRSYKKYVSGAVGLHLAQTYGRYDVRMRLANAHGVTFAALLWPVSNVWPPEVDWVEGAGDNPVNFTSAHYSAGDRKVSRRVAVDLTQWHTWTVEWTAKKLVYKVDGKTFAKVTGAAAPKVPMRPALQAQTWNCTTSATWTCPDASTPRSSKAEIDWFVAYKPTKASH